MQGTRDESGANAVEFALVLPILLILLFGTITGGVLYNQQHTLTQAAREGARFAATLDGADEETCSAAQLGDTDSWCGKTASRIMNASNGLLGIANIDEVSLTDDEIRVRVSREGRLEIIFQAWNPTLSATSIARYEG